MFTSSEFEYINQCIVTFWGLMIFKTHMYALKPFNSRRVTLMIMGGFFTKSAALARATKNVKKPPDSNVSCRNPVIYNIGMSWSRLLQGAKAL